jgi:hypothetical protein
MKTIYFFMRIGFYDSELKSISIAILIVFFHYNFEYI